MYQIEKKTHEMQIFNRRISHSNIIQINFFMAIGAPNDQSSGFEY